MCQNNQKTVEYIVFSNVFGIVTKTGIILSKTANPHKFQRLNSYSDQNGINQSINNNMTKISPNLRN